MMMEDPTIKELMRRVVAFESEIDGDCMKSSYGMIRTAAIWLTVAILSWIALIIIALR